ncbi:MAG: right-handed parallel beta-helix repeat-containing protein [Ignavibacteria bacterium]|nr:right-handed parallel beta-helix repeat-containing protein [Ignavibacteria bacterium]
MKKTLVIFIMFFTSGIFADYSTPNTSRNWNLDSLVAFSGGVVTFSSGSYMVNQTVNVLNSDTLKILSNSTVKLAQSVSLNITGTLIINPPDSMKITSIDTNLIFQEVRIDNSVASSFRKMIFEYSFNGLRMLDCSPLIEGCTFRYNCKGNGTTSTAISLFNCNSVISNSKIYRNYRVGIAGGSNIANVPQILNNLIYENDLSNGNVPQISLGQSGNGTVIIRGNMITGLAILSGGIAALPSGTLTIIIENNTIKKNRYGISLNGSCNAIIRNNIIDSNNIQGIPLQGGSGLNFIGSGVAAIVSKNIIRWNLWGVTLQSGSSSVFGDLSNPDTNYVGLNYIFFNSNSGKFYDFYNSTPSPVKAENNFWGTGNLDSIEAHICHQPDSIIYGFVDYLPIFIPVGINTQYYGVPVKYHLYEAYPNPFNPSTKLRFDVPETVARDIDINLSVFDVSGKLIRTIVEQKFPAGSYQFDFDASGLASGVYFYTLSTPFFTESKKLVLLK